MDSKVFKCVALPGLLAMLALAGCDNRNKDAILIPAASSPIADVPIPAGFDMVEAESTSRVLPDGVRFVDHKYKGDDTQIQVVKFYKDTLPTQGWVFVSQEQDHEVITLRYTKGAEDLTVTINEGTFATSIRVKIEPIEHAATRPQ